jgi:hypothetical protein
MTTDNNGKLSEKEAIENELCYLGKALHTLSLGPKEQCEIMGNFNVAWELKSDVSRGLSIVESRCLDFSAAQETAMRQLIDLLNKVPNSVLAQATTPEENLRAMRHRSWNSPRKHALIVMRAFGMETPIKVGRPQ